MNIFQLVIQNVDWMVTFNIIVLIYTFIRLFYYSSLSKLPKRAWMSLGFVIVFFLIAELTRILSVLYPSSNSVGGLTLISTFCAFAFASYLILYDIWKRQKDKIFFGLTAFTFLSILVLAGLLSQMYGYYYPIIWVLTSCLLIVKTINVFAEHLKSVDYSSEKRLLVSVFSLYLFYITLSILSFLFPLKTYFDVLVAPNLTISLVALEIMKFLTMIVLFIIVFFYKSKKEESLKTLGVLAPISRVFGIILLSLSITLLIVTNISSASVQKILKTDIHTKIQMIYDTSGLSEFPYEFKFNSAGYDDLVDEYAVRFQNVLKDTDDFSNLYLLGEHNGEFFYFLLVKDNDIVKSDYVLGDIKYYKEDDTILRQSVTDNVELVQYPDNQTHTEISIFNPEFTELGSIVFGADLNQSKWNQEISKSRALVILIGVMVSFLSLVGFENVIKSRRNAAKIELSEMKYRKIFNSSSNAIVILREKDRVITNCNNVSLSMFSKTKSELKGNVFDKLIARSSSLIFASLIESFHFGAKELKAVKMKKGKGNYFVANFKIMKYRSKDEKYIQIIIEDITKEAELLRESQEYISELEKLNKLMIGRELKMIELKKEITSLKEKYEGK